MAKKFFNVAGTLLAVAFVVISVILGIRAGMMAENVWAGISCGSSFLFGAFLFITGVWYCNKADYDWKAVNILCCISMIGVAIFGGSLATMMASDVVASINVEKSIVETGMVIGVGLFVSPVVAVVTVFVLGMLKEYLGKHLKFTLLSIGLAIAMGTGMSLVSGSSHWFMGTATAFLFYWCGIRIFAHAWKGVETEPDCKWWRVFFGLVMVFLGCGIVHIFSEMTVAVPVLHNTLVWICKTVGMVVVYALLGCIALAVGRIMLTGLCPWRMNKAK